MKSKMLVLNNAQPLVFKRYTVSDKDYASVRTQAEFEDKRPLKKRNNHPV
jgi:hypothetical protein